MLARSKLHSQLEKEGKSTPLQRQSRAPHPHSIRGLSLWRLLYAGCCCVSQTVPKLAKMATKLAKTMANMATKLAKMATKLAKMMAPLCQFDSGTKRVVLV